MTTTSLAFEATLAQPFDRAVETVTAALKAEGFGILTRIDVHHTLKEKLGVEFRPYAILGACNPTLAHKALSHYAEAGLLLPCNVTVETSGAGSVKASFSFAPETLRVKNRPPGNFKLIVR